MNDNGYGLWALVAINSLLLIVFAVLLTGPLAGLIPGVDLSHNAGHLWADLIGWKGDPYLSPFHLASYLFIGGGFWLIAAAWRHLYAAQRVGTLAIEGPYARVRHPQYVGLILIMVGFLLQWPTLATLVMFPMLLYVYRHLASARSTRSEPSTASPTTTTRRACRAFSRTCSRRPLKRRRQSQARDERDPHCRPGARLGRGIGGRVWAGVVVARRVISGKPEIPHEGIVTVEVPG